MLVFDSLVPEFITWLKIHKEGEQSWLVKLNPNHPKADVRKVKVERKDRRLICTIMIT